MIRKKIQRIMEGIVVILVVVTGCSLQIKQSDKAMPEMKIGIDASYTPYTYIDDQGKFAGLDIDLATEVCKRASYQPVFVTIDWTKKKACLSDGSIDCVWSCFSMDERQDEYTWSVPYLQSSQVVAVRSDSSVTHLMQLQGRNVAVQYDTRAEELFQQAEQDKVPKVAYVFSLSSLGECFQAMQSGNVDGVAGHQTAVETCAKSSNVSYRILPESIVHNQLGVAFDKEQAPYPMLDAVNMALTEMRQDQTTEKILRKWGMTTEQGQVDP